MLRALLTSRSLQILAWLAWLAGAVGCTFALARDPFRWLALPFSFVGWYLILVVLLGMCWNCGTAVFGERPDRGRHFYLVFLLALVLAATIVGWMALSPPPEAFRAQLVATCLGSLFAYCLASVMVWSFLTRGRRQRERLARRERLRPADPNNPRHHLYRVFP